MSNDTNTPEKRGNKILEKHEKKEQRDILRSEGKLAWFSDKIADLIKGLIETIKDLPSDARFFAFSLIAFIILIVIVVFKNEDVQVVYPILCVFLFIIVGYLVSKKPKSQDLKKSKRREIPSFRQQQTREGVKRFSKMYEEITSTSTRRNKLKLVAPIAKFLPNEQGVDEEELISKLGDSRDIVDRNGAAAILNQAIDLGFLLRRGGTVFIKDEWNHVYIKSICFIVQEGIRIESRSFPVAPPTGKNWWDSEWDEVLIHVSHVAGAEINKKIFIYLTDPINKGSHYLSSLMLLRRIINSGAPMDSKIVVEILKAILDQLIEMLSK